MAASLLAAASRCRQSFAEMLVERLLPRYCVCAAHLDLWQYCTSSYPMAERRGRPGDQHRLGQMSYRRDLGNCGTAREVDAIFSVARGTIRRVPFREISLLPA